MLFFKVHHGHGMSWKALGPEIRSAIQRSAFKTWHTTKDLEEMWGMLDALFRGVEEVDVTYPLERPNDLGQRFVNCHHNVNASSFVVGLHELFCSREPDPASPLPTLGDVNPAVVQEIFGNCGKILGQESNKHLVETYVLCNIPRDWYCNPS
ncbi:hypothetical protein T439DRAFT_216494 [Meredithblackwellia eburnea MCA 4105]